MNKFIDPPHFELEDIRFTLNLLSPGDYMSSLDLKNAYYLVPIYKKHRKFLRFIFKRKIYQFLCLPFGLCTSPYVFTKLMKPIVNKLRLDGLMILYLDDFLFISNSKVSCKKNTQKAIKILENLGFIINLSKSVNI